MLPHNTEYFRRLLDPDRTYLTNMTPFHIPVILAPCIPGQRIMRLPAWASFSACFSSGWFWENYKPTGAKHWYKSFLLHLPGSQNGKVLTARHNTVSVILPPKLVNVYWYMSVIFTVFHRNHRGLLFTYTSSCSLLIQWHIYYFSSKFRVYQSITSRDVSWTHWQTDRQVEANASIISPTWLIEVKIDIPATQLIPVWKS